MPVDTESYVFGQQISFYYKIFSDTINDYGKIEYSCTKHLNPMQPTLAIFARLLGLRTGLSCGASTTNNGVSAYLLKMNNL